MIPWSLESVWIKRLSLAAGAVLFVFGAYWLGHRNGSSQAHAEDASRYAAELARAEAFYREKEGKHVDELQKSRLAYAEVVAAAKARTDAVASDIASGSRVVGVRVVRIRATSCPAVSAPSASPTGADVEGAGELSGEAGARLYNLASDCNRVARKINALQDAMNAAVKLCDGGKL